METRQGLQEALSLAEKVPLFSEGAFLRLTRRLDLLNLVRQGVSVAEACRRLGMSRSTFYRWEGCDQRPDPWAIYERPRSPKRHPRAASTPTLELLDTLVRQHPAWGATRLSQGLRKAGLPLSPPVVQKYLLRKGWGTRGARTLSQGHELPPTPRSCPYRLAPLSKASPLQARIARARQCFLLGRPDAEGRTDGWREPLSLSEVARMVGININIIKTYADRENWEAHRQRIRIALADQRERRMEVRLLRPHEDFLVAQVHVVQLAMARMASMLASEEFPASDLLVFAQAAFTTQEIYGHALPWSTWEYEFSEPFEWVQSPTASIGWLTAVASACCYPWNPPLLAKALSMFLEGIPTGPSAAEFEPCPSLRAVAQHLEISPRSLQAVAKRQDWIGLRSRRTRDLRSAVWDRVMETCDIPSLEGSFLALARKLLSVAASQLQDPDLSAVDLRCLLHVSLITARMGAASEQRLRVEEESSEVSNPRKRNGAKASRSFGRHLQKLSSALKEASSGEDMRKVPTSQIREETLILVPRLRPR